MDKEIMAELESRGLVVIQVDRNLDKYEAEQLSECYKKQLDRGVIVLEKGASILFVDEAELLTEPKGANDIASFLFEVKKTN